jgi:prevent-host-death family protein
MNHHPRTWSLQDAKARLSEVIRLAQSEGPQTVTVHGQPAVVVSAAKRNSIDFARMTGEDFVRALSAGLPIDFELPERPAASHDRDFSFDD